MPYSEDSYMVQFGTMTGKGDHTSWLYNHPESTQSFRHNNKELQEQVDWADLIVCHNAKFELLWFKELGIDLKNTNVWCTQVAQYLLEGQFKGPKGYYTMDEVAKRRGIQGKLDRVKLYWESGYDTDEIPADILIPYNRQDNVVAGQIYGKQVMDLQQATHLSTIMQIQMGILPLLAEIEWNGMLVNMDTLTSLDVEYTQKVEDYNAELVDICGEQINWGSKPQVSALLFGGTYTVEEREEYLFTYKDAKKLPVIKERKVDNIIQLSGMGFVPPRGSETAVAGVYSVAENIIKALKGRDKKQKRFLQILQERSKAEKLRSTYFAGMQKKLVGTYIHPSMNQTIARNGRLTSSNPNGQNMPRGTTGPVKSIFISRYD
jgi:DNA polymerase I-like protein with 3'-5' exonuclease and polymerase domains